MRMMINSMSMYSQILHFLKLKLLNKCNNLVCDELWIADLLSLKLQKGSLHILHDIDRFYDFFRIRVCFGSLELDIPSLSNQYSEKARSTPSKDVPDIIPITLCLFYLSMRSDYYYKDQTIKVSSILCCLFLSHHGQTRVFLHLLWLLCLSDLHIFHDLFPNSLEYL